jgi:hypothetical protein
LPNAASLAAEFILMFMISPPELVTDSGLQPIKYLAQRLRQNGTAFVPVTGTIMDRGLE